MADSGINPLFIQYLAGLSNDLSAYGGDTSKGLQPTGTNKVTDQNVKAQTFMKLLQHALGPDSSSVKMDSKGIGITAPNDSELFKQIVGEDLPVSELAQDAPAQESAAAPAASTPTSTPASSTQAQIKMPNPFTLSPTNLNVAGTDLAGLTPENIMAVVGAKQHQDQLKMQSYRDIVDSIYKGNAMQIGAAKEARDAELAPITKELIIAQTNKAKQDTENDKPIYTVPDTNLLLNAKDYLAYQKIVKDDQPAAVKVYEYAKTPAGGNFKGSLVEFQDAAKTTHMKDYEAAVRDGYPPNRFNQWLQESIKNGAVNLGELLKKESALHDMAGENFFKDPKWINVLDSHLKDADTKDRIDYAKTPNLSPKATKEEKQAAQMTASARERAKVKMEFIHSRIVGGGGKIVGDPEPNADGKSFTWKVKWPSGNITEITQPVR